MDHYEAITRTKSLHKKLVDAYQIGDDELEFQAVDSFIIHDGFEQTSFHLNLQVLAPESKEIMENEIADLIFDELKDLSIHMRVNFIYFEEEHEHVKIDEDYPLYMNDHNTVKAEDEHEHEHEKHDEEETYDEPYMGDIITEFDEYIKAHPNASNEEVYQALTSIREDVNEKHHISKEEEEDLEDDFGNDQNE